jgi:hypothetical protein
MKWVVLHWKTGEPSCMAPQEVFAGSPIRALPIFNQTLSPAFQATWRFLGTARDRF